MDVSLFNINDDILNNYMQLIGIYILDNRLPHKVCWECAHKLEMYQSFKNKALKSRDLLLSVVGSSEFLTLRCVQSIDRTLHGLKSSLIQETSTLIDINPEFNIDSNTEINDEIAIKSRLIQETLPLIDTNINPELNIHSDNEIKDEIPITHNKIPNKINELDNSNDIDDYIDDNIDNIIDDNNDSGDDNNDSGDDTLLVEMTNKINMMRERGKLKKSKETCDNKTKTVKGDALWIEMKNKIKMMGKGGRMKRKKLKQTCGDKMGNVKNTVQIKSRRKVFVNPNLFTIQPLTHEEQIKEVANRQYSAAYKNAPYKCTTCFKGFPYKKKYETHIVKHMEESGPHECFVCKIRCKLARALRKHIVDQHTEKYICKKCPFVTKFSSVAVVHEGWHSGSSFQCPHCPCQFDRLTTYNNHLRLKHTSDFVCAFCGFTFISKKGVEVHVKKNHKFIDINAPLEGPYCKVCDIKFMNEEAYKRHLKLTSKHKNDIDPDVIGNEITQHFITCEQCGIVLEGYRNYAIHFRRVHPDKKRIENELNIQDTRYICEWCGRICKSKALLKRHTRVHTGVKPFQCSLCGKSFTVKTTLINHVRSHTETRQSYPCHICGKRFQCAQNRKRHMFIHTGLKPLLCATCGKSFRTKAQLKAHIEHVHLKKPWPPRKRNRKSSISGME